MKSILHGVARAAGLGAVMGMVMVAVSGCEWTGTSHEDSWNSRHDWVNFSGVYRSGTDERALVENFSLASGNVGGVAPEPEPAPEPDPGDDPEYAEYREPEQLGHVQASPFTLFSGTINYPNRGTAGWSLKPGSVSITITGQFTAPIGVFNDNGQGGLAGSYGQVPGGPSFSGTGTINYETGAWSLTLSPDDPFIEPAQVSYSYVYRVALDPEGDGSAPDDPNDPIEPIEPVAPPTSHGWVYTLRLEQTGNRIRFTDNREFVWEGFISSVTTPGGDSSGNTSGEVMATFEASGVTDTRYRISGTFSGQFVASTADGGGHGTLTQRRMQGIWMEPAGTGDLYGETGDISVATGVGDVPVPNP